MSKRAKTKHVAIYVRVSTGKQDTASQEPDLEHYAAQQDAPVKWYSDTASGKTMQRPGWDELSDALFAGKLSTVVVWRLDRLGRTAAGLTALFDQLQQRKVNLVSLKDGLDLSTPAGRLMCNVLASMAQFETEVRAERVLAGQARARAKGKTWGGSKPGVRKKVTKQQIQLIKKLKSQGVPKTQIALALGLNRNTIYSVIRELEEKQS